jgi:hypothetical protein
MSLSRLCSPLHGGGPVMLTTRSRARFEDGAIVAEVKDGRLQLRQASVNRADVAFQPTTRRSPRLRRAG